MSSSNLQLPFETSNEIASTAETKAFASDEEEEEGRRKKEEGRRKEGRAKEAYFLKLLVVFKTRRDEPDAKDDFPS
jgi:hypothetical protein